MNNFAKRLKNLMGFAFVRIKEQSQTVCGEKNTQLMETALGFTNFHMVTTVWKFGKRLGSPTPLFWKNRLLGKNQKVSNPAKSILWNMEKKRCYPMEYN